VREPPSCLLFLHLIPHTHGNSTARGCPPQTHVPMQALKTTRSQKSLLKMEQSQRKSLGLPLRLGLRLRLRSRRIACPLWISVGQERRYPRLSNPSPRRHPSSPTLHLLHHRLPVTSLPLLRHPLRRLQLLPRSSRLGTPVFLKLQGLTRSESRSLVRAASISILLLADTNCISRKQQQLERLPRALPVQLKSMEQLCNQKKNAGASALALSQAPRHSLTPRPHRTLTATAVSGAL